jgi:hypothetical protein
MKNYLKTFKISALTIVFGLLSSLAFAQTILKEATFDPSGKAKITNLTEVQFDEENNEMRLFFLTKSTAKRVKGEVLYFDLDFNYQKTENIEEDLEKVRTKYKLRFSLNFCPEDKEPLLTIEPNLFTGQVVFKKGYIQRFYNWNVGWCEDRFKIEDRVKPRGDDGEKIKLVTWWTKNDIFNYQKTVTNVKYGYATTTYTQKRGGAVRQLLDGENGDAVFVGLISEKGSVKENLGKNYTIQKFSASKLEKLGETKLDFEVPAEPIYKKILLNGNAALVFYREDGKYEYVEINYDTEIEKRLQVPINNGQKWVIYDANEYDGAVYVHGMLSTQKYPKNVYADLMYVHTMQETMNALSYGKSWGYQIMKIKDKRVEWCKATPASEFKTKFKAPEGEKTKPYDGSRIKVSDLHITKNGEIIIGGQMKNKSSEYLNVCAFHFSQQGDLLTHYTSKLRDKNKYNKFTSTEQAFLNSATKGTYWTVFEVAGAKTSGSTARTLYYPRIALVQPEGKGITSFTDIGNRKFYLDDKFPVNRLNDETFIFIGSNRSGKELWFSKIKLD